MQTQDPTPHTDMADELFGAHRPGSAGSAGVRLVTARAGGITVTRVQVSRDDLSRPRGRYVTLDLPVVAALDQRDEAVIETAADELRALLPAQGLVLAVGVGNRRVTADALGPRTIQKVLVTRRAAQDLPVPGLRPVAAIAPGVASATGVPLQTLLAALVRQLQPAAVLCVDSLCSAQPQRLGRSLQFSDTGLCPAQPTASRNLSARRLGVPVIAAGIPTLAESKAGPGLVVVPRELDAVISHGAALLAAAINKALQPGLSVAQLCYLAG